MTDPEHPVTRRRALQLAGGLGLAALVASCSNDGGSASPATSTASTETEAAAAAAPDCVLMPELTEGPYYLDLDLVRSDIGEGRPGLPLDLRVASSTRMPASRSTAPPSTSGTATQRALLGRRRRRGRDLLPRRSDDGRRRRRRVPDGLPGLVHGARRAHPREGACGRRPDPHGPALLRSRDDLRRLRPSHTPSAASRSTPNSPTASTPRPAV